MQAFRIILKERWVCRYKASLTDLLGCSKCIQKPLGILETLSLQQELGQPICLRYYSHNQVLVIIKCYSLQLIYCTGHRGLYCCLSLYWYYWILNLQFIKDIISDSTALQWIINLVCSCVTYSHNLGTLRRWWQIKTQLCVIRPEVTRMPETPPSLSINKATHLYLTISH